MYSAYTSGVCRPNPGKGAYGFVIFNKQKQKVYEENGVVGNYVTINIAKYTAVINALEKALSLGIRNIEIFSDSKLVVQQLNNVYQARDSSLRKLYKKAKKLAEDCNSASFAYISRGGNKLANSLANEIFGEPDSRRAKAEKLAKDIFVKTDTGYIYIKENDNYFVDPINQTCTCPDKQNRGGLCKHIMAAQILEQRVAGLKAVNFQGVAFHAKN